MQLMNECFCGKGKENNTINNSNHLSRAYYVPETALSMLYTLSH